VTSGAANAKTVIDMYSPIASDYEEIWAPRLRPFALQLLERLSLGEARRVLDLGCGVGRLLPDIQEAAPDAFVVGSDLTHEMVRRADPRFGRVAMDGMRLGFADGTFDAVVSSFALFHFPNPPGALVGVRSAIRSGGRIGIAVWGTGELFPAMTAWDEESDRIGVPPDPAAAGPGDGRDQVDSPDKLRSVLERAGFSEASAGSAEWHVEWDMGDFIEWRLRMGPSRRRLEQLDPDERKRTVSALRDHVAALGPDALLHHDEVVLGTATA
jgi:SAM-dependent methyltransferase